MVMVRHIDRAISSHFAKHNKILALFGDRQVGKTTLLKRIFPKGQYLDVETEPVRRALESYDSSTYQQLLDVKKDLVIIDEIQKLTNPGRAARIFFDQIPQYKLAIAASTDLNIKNKRSESLEGRKIDYHLYPLSLSEYLVQQGLEKKLSFRPIGELIKNGSGKKTKKTYDLNAILNNILIHGLYPAMQSHPSSKDYLASLIDNFVFKDLDDLSLLDNKPAALSLLKLLAHQSGSLVNYAQLASRLGISPRTVKRYVELFEQSNIVFKLEPYSTQKIDEITKTQKVYFCSLGIRNALINNFEAVETRGDAQALFENFIVVEFLKYNYYGRLGYGLNFWRTKSGSEVALVISKTGRKLTAVDIRSQGQRANRAFGLRYPKSKTTSISKEDFIRAY